MSLLNALNKKQEVALIADIKLQSPRDGELIEAEKAPEFAKKAIESGADALSVVTEEKHYNGSNKLLKEVNEVVDVPIISKDFYKNEKDIINAFKEGADSVLLIASVLGKEKLKELYELCRDRDREPVVETHTKEEILFANQLDARIIAINNRDITELEMDSGTVENTKKLSKYVNEDALLISESSIQEREEIDLIEEEIDAAVVGTSILCSKNPMNKIKKLKGS